MHKSALIILITKQNNAIVLVQTAGGDPFTISVEADATVADAKAAIAKMKGHHTGWQHVLVSDSEEPLDDNITLREVCKGGDWCVHLVLNEYHDGGWYFLTFSFQFVATSDSHL